MCLSGDGSTYRGYVSETTRGHRCLNWDRFPHPWGPSQGLGNHNYCRYTYSHQCRTWMCSGEVSCVKYKCSWTLGIPTRVWCRGVWSEDKIGSWGNSATFLNVRLRLGVWNQWDLGCFICSLLMISVCCSLTGSTPTVKPPPAADTGRPAV